MRERRLRFQRIAFGLLAVLLLGGAGPLGIGVTTVSAANFATRQVSMSDNLVNAVANYTLAFSGQSAGTVGSIRLQLCTNDPFIGTPCNAPAGLDITTATLSNQSGMTGFTISPNTTANQLVLTRTPDVTLPGTSSYELQGVHNPSSAGTVFGRLETFASTDASGAHLDASGLAVNYMANAVSVSTYVPPYLLFCAGNTIQPYDCATAQGNFVDFGELSYLKTSTGQTQLLAATNADYGYTIRVIGTTLTSGINVIPALQSSDIARTGVNQFGLNLRANSTPPTGSDVQGSGSAAVASGYDTPNYFKFVSGDVLASSTTSDSYRLYTVSYITNITKNQPAGIYVSTLQYIALASF